MGIYLEVTKHQNAEMDKTEIRRQRLKKLISERFGNNQASFARAISKDPSYVGRMLFEPTQKGFRGISEDMRDHIESCIGLPSGWLDGISDQTRILLGQKPGNLSEELVVSKLRENGFEVSILTPRILKEKQIEPEIFGIYFIPDLLIQKNGNLIFVEVKDQANMGTITQAQRIRQSEHLIYVTPSKIERAIEEINLRFQLFSQRDLINHPKAFDIPMLDEVGSMGQGHDLSYDGDQIIDFLPISLTWIEQTVRVHPENLRVITGAGDSMKPTFSHGDLLLVDISHKKVDVDGVYAMSAHQRLFIKRVRQRLDGLFEVSSDNPTVKTVDVLNGQHEVTIHGRVVWTWNGSKL